MITFTPLDGRDRALRQFRHAVNLLRARWSLAIGPALKRLLDILVSGLALMALAPVFAIVGGAIKATDGGPVLFWQTRVGRYGRLIRFPKFRSMVLDAEAVKQRLLAANDHGDSVTFKMKRDPRITPIGRLIRRLSIDELPQLYLVLKGDLTLVGPRPPVPSEVVRYTLRQRRRLDVVPGLTCIWQVSGRSDIPFEQQARMDIDYIDRRSVWFDLSLLIRTIPAVLFGRGAY